MNTDCKVTDCHWKYNKSYIQSIDWKFIHIDLKYIDTYRKKNTGNSDLEYVDTYRKFTDIDLVKIHKYYTYRKVSNTDSKCTDTYWNGTDMNWKHNR